MRLLTGVKMYPVPGYGRVIFGRIGYVDIDRRHIKMLHRYSQVLLWRLAISQTISATRPTTASRAVIGLLTAPAAIPRKKAIIRVAGIRITVRLPQFGIV
jgi:hypothetical protein